MVSGLRYQVSGLRDIYVDSLRGLAVIFVVLGHALGWFNEIKFTRIISSLVYSFHVPLLFMIAGYVSGISRKKLNFRDYVIKNFIDLYIPCMFFSYLQFACNKFVFASFNPAGFRVPDYHELYTIPFIGFKNYWFLCTLFFVKVLDKIFSFNEKINYVLWLIISAVIINFRGIVPEFLTQFYYGLYFCAGKILERSRFIIHTKIFYGVIFILLASILFADGIDLGRLSPLRTVIAVCMSLGLFIIFHALKIDNKFLVLCGVNSMVIYTIHNFIAAPLRIICRLSGINTPILMLIFCFAMAVLIPLFIVKLYKKYKFLRWIEYIFYPGKLFAK